MKLFISWSGTRSKAMAEVLCEWIPDVIQRCEPWISSMDIDPGARWSSDLAKELEQTKFGIICLTSENLKSRWIHFEAGALSKILDDKTRVCPYLLELKPTDIDGPLVQFQAIRADEDGTLKLLNAINKAVGGGEVLTEDRLNRTFITNWPKLQKKLKEISESVQSDKKSKRTDRELIEEILKTVRDQSKMMSSDSLRYYKDFALSALPMASIGAVLPTTSREVECLDGTSKILLDACKGMYKELKDHKIEIPISEIERKLNENLLIGMPISPAILDVRAHFFTKAGIKPPRCSLEFPSLIPWRDIQG
jgi:hypothetical protein